MDTMNPQAPACTTFTFMSDPGHGWLMVTPEQIAQIGLTETDFSPCSYRSRNGMIALEEDGDAGVFLDTWTEKVGPVRFNEHNVESTDIRDCPPFGTMKVQS